MGIEQQELDRIIKEKLKKLKEHMDFSTHYLGNPRERTFLDEESQLCIHERAGELITLVELYNEFFPFSSEYQEFAQEMRGQPEKLITVW